MVSFILIFMKNYEVSIRFPQQCSDSMRLTWRGNLDLAKEYLLCFSSRSKKISMVLSTVLQKLQPLENNIPAKCSLHAESGLDGLLCMSSNYKLNYPFQFQTPDMNSPSTCKNLDFALLCKL